MTTQTQTQTPKTIKPVTLSGWYELEDGRVQRFGWRDGFAVSGVIVAGWADVADHALAEMDARTAYEAEAERLTQEDAEETARQQWDGSEA